MHKKPFALLWTALLLCCLVFSTAFATSLPAPGKITASQAQALLSAGNAVAVDVRETSAYAKAHIENAYSLPMETLKKNVYAILPVLQVPVVVYGQNETDTKEAYELLTKMHYTNVYEMGGMDSWTYETVAGEPVWEKKEQLFSSFRSTTLEGLPVDETIFAGNELTLVNFWGTFCPPCLYEMPFFAELNKEYQDKGVGFVGIIVDAQFNMNGTFNPSLIRKANALVAKTGANYLHLMPSMDLHQAKLKNVASIPETIFVDSKGNIVGQSYVGAKDKADWASIIDALLLEVE